MQLYGSGRCIIRHSGSLKQWTTRPYAHHPPPGSREDAQGVAATSFDWRYA